MNYTGMPGVNPMYNNPSYGTNRMPNMYAPRYELLRINNIQSAYSINMAPNSETIAVNRTDPTIGYLIQTDGAGAVSVYPFKMEAIQQNGTGTDIENRLASLEKTVQELKGMVNNESASTGIE